MAESSSAPALASTKTPPPLPAHNGLFHHVPKGSLAKLMVGAIGVVYGDIGTSPLYALRETFTSHHNIVLNHENLLGVLSLMFWSLMLIVTIKYVIFMMRADNRGEGGSLALLALISRKLEGGTWTTWIVLLGMFATALFVGDSMITPAISVLSAVGGLKIINPGFEHAVVPLTLVILVGLFVLQRSGTTKVGALFGPIMVVFFLVIGSLGVINIMQAPQILAALAPHHAILFFVRNGFDAFLSLGSAVLAVTGAEALYADMGHFGARPIRYAWLGFCFPALILNYLGQGALLLTHPTAITNPFFLLAPAWALVPMVILATAATIIASQAVISGAFSVTQASVQLGFLPRLSIKHTSADAHGQIYVGFVNWGLMICVAALVITFKNDSNLAAAYGIAVTGTMTISTILFGVVMFRLWKWNVYLAGALLALLLVVDLSYLTANLFRIPEGGWVPLLIGVIIFTLLTTWSRGRELLMAKMRESALPLDLFIKSAKASATRVPGTAVFLTSTAEGVPPGLLHNMKHNKVLHERVVFLTVKIEEVPFVPEEQRLDYIDLGNGFFRLVVTYGFMQEPDIPMALVGCNRYGPMFKMMETSFFLNRQTLIASDQPGMPIWREVVFSWMLRNATSAMEFFRLPTNRVVELGSQVEI